LYSNDFSYSKNSVVDFVFFIWFAELILMKWYWVNV